MLYASLAAVFAYAGFRRGEAAVVRGVVAAMSSLLLVSGLLLALAMGVLGLPSRGGIGNWGWRTPPWAD